MAIEPQSSAPPPSAQPPRRPVPDAASVSRAVRRFALALAATALVSLIALPWSLGALPLAVLTIVLGIRALVLRHRAKVPGLGAVLVAVGMAFVLMVSIGLIGSLLLWPQQEARRHCLGRALTISAQETCEQQFTDDVRQWQQSVLDRLEPTGR